MGPRFRVSSERLEKSGIEPTTPGLEGEQLNHYATEASYSGYIIGIFLHVLLVSTGTVRTKFVFSNCTK